MEREQEQVRPLTHRPFEVLARAAVRGDGVAARDGLRGVRSYVITPEARAALERLMDRAVRVVRR